MKFVIISLIVTYVLNPKILWKKIESSKNVFSPRAGLCTVAYKEKIQAIGGVESSSGNQLNDFQSSPDGGQTWDKLPNAPFEGRAFFGAVTFKNKLFVIAGWNGSVYFNDVWAQDGQSWSKVGNGGFAKRHGLGAVSTEDYITIMGGVSDQIQQLNDVWSSTDGETWKMLKANNDQGFSKRAYSGATVLKGIIQVAAGDGHNELNDVWSSSDLGKTWIQVLEHAAFGTRRGLALMAQQGMLLVIGGQNGSVFYNDTWISTTNGETWVNVTDQGETQTGRAWFGAVISDEKIIVMGGAGAGNKDLNDIQWTQGLGACKVALEEGICTECLNKNYGITFSADKSLCVPCDEETPWFPQQPNICSNCMSQGEGEECSRCVKNYGITFSPDKSVCVPCDGEQSTWFPQQPNICYNLKKQLDSKNCMSLGKGQRCSLCVENQGLKPDNDSMCELCPKFSVWNSTNGCIEMPCIKENKHIQNYKCVDICPKSTIPIQELNRCVSNCKEYNKLQLKEINGENEQCVDELDCQDKQKGKKFNQQCVPECPSNGEQTQNNNCFKNCSPEETKTKNLLTEGKECVEKCGEDQNIICQNKCQERPEENEVLSIKETAKNQPGQCHIEKCPSFYKLVEKECSQNQQISVWIIEILIFVCILIFLILDQRIQIKSHTIENQNQKKDGLTIDNIQFESIEKVLDCTQIQHLKNSQFQENNEQQSKILDAISKTSPQLFEFIMINQCDLEIYFKGDNNVSSSLQLILPLNIESEQEKPIKQSSVMYYYIRMAMTALDELTNQIYLIKSDFDAKSLLNAMIALTVIYPIFCQIYYRIMVKKLRGFQQEKDYQLLRLYNPAMLFSGQSLKLQGEIIDKNVIPDAEGGDELKKKLQQKNNQKIKQLTQQLLLFASLVFAGQNLPLLLITVCNTIGTNNDISIAIFSILAACFKVLLELKLIQKLNNHLSDFDAQSYTIILKQD